MNDKILFCTEVPTAHLDEIHPLIDWHFVIASECLKDPAYFSWYENRPRDAKVMLDNGMFEEGKPLEPEALIDLALQIKPEIVFAPDQVGDKIKTLRMTESFIQLSDDLKASWRVGVIPQGRTEHEIVDCHNQMLRLPFDGPIGISFLNDRPKVINAMNAGGYWKPDRWYHFLGMYNLDEISSWPPYVKSMDTIKPFKAAMYGYELHECPRGLGKWNTSIKMPHHNKELMYYNYKVMHAALERKLT